MSNLNDEPIKKPDEDDFGLENFSKSISEIIANLKNPDGTVIAINGPWGSGKTSFINLIRHHLTTKPDGSKRSDVAEKSDEKEISDTGKLNCWDQIKSWWHRLIRFLIKIRFYKKHNTSDNSDHDTRGRKLEIVDFYCWWFKDEETLVLEFLRTIISCLDRSSEAKNLSLKLLPSLLSITSAAASMAGNHALPGSGKLAAAPLKALKSLLDRKDTVESNFSKLQELLRATKKFLIVIDDMDRLPPDELMAIFRLIKTVGRLPNVIYLLSFDRTIAERVLQERFPSEGPHYLEKIIQASFDLPKPDRKILIQLLKKRFTEICKFDVSDDDNRLRIHRFIDDVVGPEIRTPRDVHRIINSFEVLWPAFKKSGTQNGLSEIDPIDFLCLETYRILRPELYNAIRSNKFQLTETNILKTINPFDREQNVSEYNYKGGNYTPQAFGDIIGNANDRLQHALALLFPSLNRHLKWGDDVYRQEGFYKADSAIALRRICSPNHFDLYFKFSPPKDTINIGLMAEILDGCDDEKFVLAKLSDPEVNTGRLLGLLEMYLKDIPRKKAAKFMSTLFILEDAIKADAICDRFKFEFASHHIHLASMSLIGAVISQLSKKELPSVLQQVADFTPFFRFVRVARAMRIWIQTSDNYHLKSNKAISASTFSRIILGKIRKSAEDETLLKKNRLLELLVQWVEIANCFVDKNIERETQAYLGETRNWCTSQLSNDEAVIIFATIIKKLVDAQTEGNEPNLDLIQIGGHLVGGESMQLYALFDLEELRNRAGEVLKQGSLSEDERGILKRVVSVINKN